MQGWIGLAARLLVSRRVARGRSAEAAGPRGERAGRASALLFLAFVVGIASAWARGLQIDCGCFGGGGFEAGASAKYPWEIARDLGLLAVSAYLVWRPRGRLAADTLLTRERLDS